MTARLPNIQRIVSIGLTWGFLWFVASLSILAAIGILDPRSIDPGELQAGVAIFGSMALLSGLAFATFLSLGERDVSALRVPPARVALWGALGSTVVQAGYLGHGDAGLAANVQIALIFVAFGTVITLGWLILARRWTRSTRHVARPGTAG